ncbi:DALR anticodon-binding domain-containing protein [Actinokineospora pegani]|uniref:DALR anticodon-binding domain-containing protein n=1 Tax=Actinokineospora pegani TaxID=2654637 RepID=UPI0012EADD34|nr:DALR anticodon-binding domain-containing protein [Actinokineospora pegani]
MTREALADLVRDAALGVLGDPTGLPADIPLRRPVEAAADYTTSLPLRLAKVAGVPARELAERIAAALTGEDVSAVAAGPGFVTITLSDRARARIVDEALAQPLPPAVAPSAHADPRRRWVAEALARLGTDDAGLAVAPARLPETVEPDSLRFAVLATPLAAEAVVDPDRWGPRLPHNPAFRARHAHARLCGLLRGAADLGLPAPTPGAAPAPPPDTLGVVRALADHRSALDEAARLREPHRVAQAAAELAEAAHALADGGRVLPIGDAPADGSSPARLALCAATRRALAAALGVLGVDAPERI